MSRKKIITNSIMQYQMIIAQYIFPLLTFPYLTRVLEPNGYAVVTYMSSLVVYFQYLIDYGFSLSSTKKVAENQNNAAAIETVWGWTTQAKLLLSLLAIIIFCCMIPFIKILHDNILVGCLYLCVPLLSVFLPDYLFRGLEDMGIVTKRFVIAKAISTTLTFVLISKEEDILIVPILNILSSLVSIILTQIHIKKKYGYIIRYSKLNVVVSSLREGVTYFASTAATTAFGAFNTFMLGIMPISTAEIGCWGAYYGLIGSAQSLYTPIVNSIYPHMVKATDFKLIKKILRLFMPLILIASCLTAIFAKGIISALCGPDYLVNIHVFRLLIPLLFISFPTVILNFPVLGATGHIKKTAILTLAGAAFHVVGLLMMGILERFTIENVAILRCITEGVLLTLILVYVSRETNFFIKDENLDGKKERNCSVAKSS